MKLMPYHLVITDVLKPTLNQDKLLSTLDHFNRHSSSPTSHPASISASQITNSCKNLGYGSLDEDSDKWRCTESPCDRKRENGRGTGD